MTIISVSETPVIIQSPQSTIGITGAPGASDAAYQTLSALENATVQIGYNTVDVLAYASPGDLGGYRMQLKRIGAPLTATNSCLYNRDLTNAAWTKTNCTAARATGVDGVSNSGTLLTATAPNATCSQTITLPSSARTLSAYVQRSVGTGAIYMTTDGGSTYVNITTELSLTGGFARPIIDQTVTNPQIIFKIATPGDAIVVDYVQNEAQAYFPVATPPIHTGGTAVTALLPWCYRSVDRFLPNGSTDNTNGGYWALCNSNVTPAMFGAVADGVTNDYFAINAMVYYAAYYNAEYPSFGVTGLVDCHFDRQRYYLSQTIIIVNQQFRMFGRTVGNTGSHKGTQLVFPANTVGIWNHQINLQGCRIEGFSIIGGGGTGTGYGIVTQTPIELIDIRIQNWALDGIYSYSGTDSAGNVSNTDRSYVRNYYCDTLGRHAINLQGGDSNIWLVENMSASTIGGSLIFCEAGFGSQFINVQVQGSGTKRYQTRPGVQGCACVGSDGKVYQVIPGHETAASTSDPTTDGAVNWVRCPGLDSAIVANNIPNWTTGLTWQGAPVVYDNALNGAAAAACVLIGLYIEAPGSPDPLWQGLIISPRADLPPILPTTNAGGISNSTTNDGLYSSTGYITNVGTDRSTLRIGGPKNDKFLETYDVASNASFYWTWSKSQKDLWFCRPDGAAVLGFSGDNSTNTFGRGAGVGSGKNIPYLKAGLAFTGPSDGGRIIGQTTAQPSTSGCGVGEFAFNAAPSAANGSFVFGWSCTVQGSPDTWKPVYAAAVPIYAPCTYAQLVAPATAGAGARGYITDSNVALSFGANVTAGAGGSTNKGPIWTDGTNWYYG